MADSDAENDDEVAFVCDDCGQDVIRHSPEHQGRREINGNWYCGDCAERHLDEEEEEEQEEEEEEDPFPVPVIYEEEEEDESTSKRRRGGVMDWALRYGRTGFHAGIGGERPFNKPNKPTFNISVQDMDRLGQIPQYYSDNPKQVVFWNQNYTEPLSNQTGHFENLGSNKRIRKRNYIKNRSDDKDPFVFNGLVRDIPATEDLGDEQRRTVNDLRKRKYRRQALSNNPLRADLQENLLPANYDRASLTPKQVLRREWISALQQYALNRQRRSPSRSRSRSRSQRSDNSFWPEFSQSRSVER